ncbi:MAG TPA: AAA family ATPase, partial [Gaiellaceae bacterium]|nr:AAA family ATPase [Gaiellaceae bacterium]
QSDIFIGLYWESYGWVAPEMSVSGLEDEFDLSGSLPRLLYVKAPAPEREPRLADLLSRMENEASYRRFRTATELGRLVRDDLATLLSERFSPAPSPPRASGGRAGLPGITTPLIGREDAIDEVAGLFGREDIRLVTLTGPGGVGKTRLAVAVGERMRHHFTSGVAFARLAPVTEPEEVLARLGRAVGAEVAGTDAPLDALAEHLGDGRWLLILDNLEQVVDVARDLYELLARCPGVAILATSRFVLRMVSETEYPVDPLPLPPDPGAVSLDELASSPAVALFLDRARAVRRDFALTESNAQDVCEICRRLEGLPLAIELAAARLRLLEPGAVLRRLNGSLDALASGAVDMPERQHTLRATVEWSVGLLDADERSLLEIAAVFVDGWTVEAAAHVAELDEDRALELNDALAGHSLISLDMTDRGPRPRMLETIRVFVAERMAARPDLTQIQSRHADYYRSLAERADRPIRSFGQNEWLERLKADAANLRAAASWYLANEPDRLPHLFRVLTPVRALWPNWGVRYELIGEGRSWMERLLPTADSLDTQAAAELLSSAEVIALEASDEAMARATRDRLTPLLDQLDDPYLVAVCGLVNSWTSSLVAEFDRGVREAGASLERLRGQDEPLWTGLALMSLGGLEAYAGRYDDAEGHLTEARDLATRFDNDWLAAASRVRLGMMALGRGSLDEARGPLDEALDISVATDNVYNVILCLAAFAQLALVDGDAERAALLAGAAGGLRRREGLEVFTTLTGEAWIVDLIRQALAADSFDRAFAAGSRLNLREAVAVAGERRNATI